MTLHDRRVTDTARLFSASIKMDRTVTDDELQVHGPLHQCLRTVRPHMADRQYARSISDTVSDTLWMVAPMAMGGGPIAGSKAV